MALVLARIIQISALSTFDGRIVAYHGGSGDGELGFDSERSLRSGYHIQGRQQARKLPNLTRELNLGMGRRSAGEHRSACLFCRRSHLALTGGSCLGAVTLKKLECSKQAYALYTLAWDNIIGFRSYCVGPGSE
ncbi:hypothetical protein Bca101_101475 [Brassica carinata]